MRKIERENERETEGKRQWDRKRNMWRDRAKDETQKSDGVKEEEETTFAYISHNSGGDE